MISPVDAATADVFHIHHGPHIPCAVWHRDGVTHYGPGIGQYRVGLVIHATRENGVVVRPAEYHAITPVNAGDFYVAPDCPCASRPAPAADPAQPVLVPSSGRPEGSGAYDASGYDAEGYDAFGYDAEGYDRRGYSALGYDREGYDEEGWDAGGEDRYGNNRNHVDVGDLDLAGLWSEFTASGWCGNRERRFREHLQELVSDPDEIDALGFCGSCGEPEWDDELSTTGTGSRLCESCWENWSSCERCEDRFHPDDMTTTLGESEICERCRVNYYSYCDDCEGWYPDEDEDEHEHSVGDCCDSPALAFEIPRDGATLPADTRATITLPAGTITDVGLRAIRELLIQQSYDSPEPQNLRNVAYDLGKLGDEWQTRTGNYAKRLSRMAYKEYQVALTPALMAQVGNLARAHSMEVSVEIETTRDLNMSAGDFYHEDSCWWGSYSESRCALKSNGGFALRSFYQHSNGVSGRAWVMPLRLDEYENLTPTFNTASAAAYVIFNGYGDLASYAAPRIIAAMAGWTYRKVGFTCSPMYINAGGYLVAPEALADRYTDGNIVLSVRQHARLYDTEKVLTHA